jgi:uncharacterized membrane protein YedE/YeeE
MTNFTPVSAAIGGALIGLSAVLLMLTMGRVAGISGIFAGCITPAITDRDWRGAFLAGLLLAPVTAILVGPGVPEPTMPALWVAVLGGLLVGFGSRLGSGCTSGHGICGIARLSPRSLVATAMFMLTAMATVALVRHGIGG